MLPSGHSPCVTFCSCFLPPPGSCSPALPLLLHRFSLPCNLFVLLGACSGLSFDTWKKQDSQSAVMLMGSFCLPSRPISLTSSASLRSSPAMQCFQTISMRMKSECCRPLVYKSTRETIPVRSEQYFFGLFHVLWLNIKHFPVSACLLQVDDGFVAMYWASS